MPRLFVLWTRPYHLSLEEAETWAREELRHLAELDGIERTVLTPLDGAGDRHRPAWDWLLELHLADGGSVDDCLEAEACRRWLSDLRALRLQPAVFAAGEPVSLSGAEG